MKILKDQGIFSFICSNKFAKAQYGEKLRKLILKNQLKIFNDFTGINVFKEASVDTCVIQIKKDYIENNEVFVDDNYFMKQNRLDSNSFIFNSPEVLNLRDKIFNEGTMIKDLDIEINRGILTGFNEAFIIDEDTKNRLIREDSNNKEIIKPLLRGRDINKWKVMYKNLYLIHSVDGLDTKNKYPSIYQFLSHYQEKLEKRYDKGKNWYNLRACKYDDLFEKEKIIYREISSEPNFTFDSSNYFLGNTAYIINSDSINLKYILGLLNSNVLFWTFKQICYNLGKTGFRFIKIFVEQLPIKINENYEKEVIDIVDEILEINHKIIHYELNLFIYLDENLGIIDISKKLESFYLLNEKQFLKEIKNKTKNFDVKELLSIFNLSKNEILTLNNEFKIKNNKLNQIVYNIYKLDDGEIKIIEENI
ncbi:type II restriction/modification system protein [Methanobrevibacter olleyae]|uniref:site-specific DNA-methyltransferase (adenine-specific) n=1 Tax=Methanobrevibacter olleyae TaxID=294671 RepID=A0A126QZM9_METOL|nr:type II restriction/modification system protein [Methanobrevibacter olleyae]